MSNLRSKQKYADGAWDFTALNDCFGGTKIRGADVDFEVERNGRFLRCEFKPAIDAVRTGQKLHLEAVARIPQFTVLVVIGNPPFNPVAYVRVPHWANVIPTSVAQFKSGVSRWYQYANSSQALHVHLDASRV